MRALAAVRHVLKSSKVAVAMRDGEERAHAGADGFDAEGIAGLADEDDAVAAGGVGRADHRAEIAGVADFVEGEEAARAGGGEVGELCRCAGGRRR